MLRGQAEGVGTSVQQEALSGISWPSFWIRYASASTENAPSEPKGCRNSPRAKLKTLTSHGTASHRESSIDSAPSGRAYFARTSSNVSLPTLPPRIDLATFWAKRSRFWRRSLAASEGAHITRVSSRSKSQLRERIGSGSARNDGANERKNGEPTLVEGIVGVRFEEEVLQPDHDGVQVEDGFPVLAEDVEADVAVEVEVGVVHFRDAFHFRRLVRVVVVDCESKLERAALVHACGRERWGQRGSERFERDRHGPSSGWMVSSKLSKSSGLGKCVFIVDGRSSSVKSARGRVPGSQLERVRNGGDRA